MIGILKVNKWVELVLILSIICELFFFTSWPNFVGCTMTFLVWLNFKVYLKRDTILRHPFSFLAFSSLFFACIIPLVGTLIEFKPISYGFQNPFETFFFQILIYFTASAAFYSVIYNRSNQINIIQRTLYKLNFFKVDILTLWLLGLVGLFSRIQNLALGGDVEYGDSGNKFLSGLMYLQYSPLIMLFPSISRISFNKRNNSFVLLYAFLMFILSFATNSRQQMIYPFITIILLFLLYILQNGLSLFKLLSPLKIVSIVVFIVFGIGFLSDISLAMLANRNIRNNINRVELLYATIETLQNGAVMNQLRNTTIEDERVITRYNRGWDESYLSNFMLNRYGNARVIDETLYYANKIGFGNKKMLDSFVSKVYAIFPIPILSFLGIHLNKNDLEYSPGDMLYSIGNGNNYGLGGFRVTSLAGDGLATFSYWCFPILYILFFLSFKLMDCLVIVTKHNVLFSTLGLINIFGFLGMYRNSIGFITPVTFILRGFWQLCFTYLLMILVIKISNSRIVKFK